MVTPYVTLGFAFFMFNVSLVATADEQDTAPKRIRYCKEGEMGYLSGVQSEGGIAYYLAETKHPQGWQDIACGLRVGQLVTAGSTEKEM